MMNLEVRVGSNQVYVSAIDGDGKKADILTLARSTGTTAVISGEEAEDTFRERLSALYPESELDVDVVPNGEPGGTDEPGSSSDTGAGTDEPQRSADLSADKAIELLDDGAELDLTDEDRVTVLRAAGYSDDQAREIANK